MHYPYYRWSPRDTTGNLAGSSVQPVITCSHSLTKRSIAIGGGVGRGRIHGHNLEGAQLWGKSVQVEKLSVKLFWIVFILVNERKCIPICLIKVCGSVMHIVWWGWVSVNAWVWVVGVPLCYRRIQLRAKSQRPHAKNCTLIPRTISAGGKTHFCAALFGHEALISPLLSWAHKERLIWTTWS